MTHSQIEEQFKGIEGINEAKKIYNVKEGNGFSGDGFKRYCYEPIHPKNLVC
jgi:hypothetical protein